MKKYFFAKAFAIGLFASQLCACNGGKHEADINLKDSTAVDSGYEGGKPGMDKTDTLYNTDTSKRVDSSGQ